MKVKVTQSCQTLCDPMDYTVHGIPQARILEWVASPFSRGSSQTTDRTQVSRIAGGFFTSWTTREAYLEWVAYPFSRGSSQPRNGTRVSCIAGRFFTNWAIRKSYWRLKGFPGAQRIKNPPAMRVRAVSWKDPLEEGMATHSSILAWRIPWTEEPGRLQSWGLKVGHNWATKHKHWKLNSVNKSRKRTSRISEKDNKQIICTGFWLGLSSA